MTAHHDSTTIDALLREIAERDAAELAPILATIEQERAEIDALLTRERDAVDALLTDAAAGDEV